jgi:hypothetical protein
LAQAGLKVEGQQVVGDERMLVMPDDQWRRIGVGTDTDRLGKEPGRFMEKIVRGGGDFHQARFEALDD